MADGIFASKVSATRDANAAANPIFVQLSDGTNVLDTANGGVEVVVNNTSIAVTDGGGSITVDGTVAISGTVTIDANSSDVTVDNAAGAAAVNIQDGGNSITVDASQLDIDNLNDTDDKVAIGDGTDTLGINTDGSINVNVVSSTLSDEVHDYDTQASLASDTADNHDYTVTGTTFLLQSVIVSASGDCKFEIQTGPVASLATVAVGFLTGKEGDTKQIIFNPAVEVPVTSTGTVRVIRTNREGTAQDVYSTIIGRDLA